jgi:putative tryptophan/tyrosine transport system substrate-binding protein
MTVIAFLIVVAYVAVLLGPLACDAQPALKVPRIGMINEFSAAHPFVAAFRRGLAELGYTEGQSIIVEYRHADGALDRVSNFAAELVRLRVEVLVVGGTRSAQLARAQTTTVPIVFATSGDPVSSGLARSLAHPGGNATGISIVSPELSGKQLEFLKVAVPKSSRVSVLHNPTNPAAQNALTATREAARTLALELQLLEVRQPNELPSAFSTLTGWGAGGLLVLPDPVLGNELDQIAKLAAKNRVPAIYLRREFAETGGLMAYGPSFPDNYRRAAVYVDRILKGAKPADLPIEQPTKFELVINLKAAKTLGLRFPRSLLSRADDLIQ